MRNQGNEGRPATFGSVAMDSRKLLSLINSSAQSQVKIFEEAVQKLGQKIGRASCRERV